MTLMMLPLWMWGVANAGDVVSTDATGTSFRIGERYTVSDDVLAVLGVHSSNTRADEIDFGVSLDARIATNIDCGKLKLDVDINGSVTDVVNQLPGQLSSAGAALVSAAPMLFLCHASPSLCSELKNLNLRIDEDLDFRYAACKSIDNYIDKQASEGDANWREMENNWLRTCHQEKIDLGMTVQDASVACQAEARDPRPTSIIQGFAGQVFETAPQQIVRDGLRAVGKMTASNPKLEEFMIAILGDARIGVNGEWTPLIAEGGSAGAAEFQQSLLYYGTAYACDIPKLRLVVPLEPLDPDANYVTMPDEDDWTDYTKELIKQVIAKRMTYSNTTDLTVLGWHTQDYECHVLGKSLAYEAAMEFQSEWDGAAAKAGENPELPEYGKAKMRSFQNLMQDTVELFERDDTVISVSDQLVRIKAQADELRQQARELANVIEAGEAQRVQNAARPCDSFTSCGGFAP